MGEAVLEHNDRDPTFGLTVPGLTRALVARLTNRVQAAYFFGSIGTEDFGPDSDVDLILVVATGQPFVERPRQFADLLDLVPSLDLLVYTEEELARLTRDPSPGFWRSVTASMRRIL